MKRNIKKVVDGNSLNIKSILKTRRWRMTEPEGKKTTKLLRGLDIKPALKIRTADKEAAHIKPVLQARGKPQDKNTTQDE